MGYYTSYSLDVFDEQDKHLIQKFREECSYAATALLLDGSPRGSHKWYNHEEDLVKFSRKYPLALFLLSGQGEDIMDDWRMYVKNGDVNYDSEQQRMWHKRILDKFKKEPVEQKKDTSTPLLVMPNSLYVTTKDGNVELVDDIGEIR